MFFAASSRRVSVEPSAWQTTWLPVAWDGSTIPRQRSDRAWRTHPRNYRRIERMATDAGAWLLGCRLEWAWCHLAVRADQLASLLPDLRQQDLSLLAEILLALLRAGVEIQTRDVDWLAWEDPFITGCRASALRAEREGSLAETRKRLAYVIPKLQLLAAAASEVEHAED